MSNGGAGRVTIPAKVKRVIKNIQEIAGNHDDEEVYLMLKECNMDPNETAQKLLSQDSFHEVRRKRDRRKENVKESAGSRRKPMQDQGRSERGNHSSRYITHDAGGVGQNFVSIKENGASNVLADRVAIPTLSNSQDIRNEKATDASSNFNVDTYAGVTSESKSVGHAVQTVAATSVDPTGSIPLLEDGVQSTEVIGPQKELGPTTEWKPKHTNPSLPDGPDATIPGETSQVAIQTTFGLEKKLEETCISDSRQVIIPKHIHVPEVEKLGFIFGSFDASFSLSTSDPVCPESERSPILGTSKGSEEDVDHSSNHNELISVEDNNYPALSDVSESLISDAHDVSSTVVQEYSESKEETDLPPGYQQYSTVHAYPNYGFGIMPPMVASQIVPTDSTKSRGHDVSRLPGFVLQQPYDLNSYYAQFYRPGVDNEGRLSQSYEPSLPSKVNGNVTVPPETSQSSLEGENTLILPTSASNSPVTQAAGVVPSSVATTHQAVPVFGQPAGLHLPHYPNYIPFHFLPYYVPPPAIHHFLSTGVLPPPQHQVGSVYPAPGPADKYSVPQYKPGTTTVNTNDVAAPGSYGPYSSTPASVSASSATTTGHSNSSEDLLPAQIKDNNLYVGQSEGPGVWFATPGRDISGLQANTFYNFPQAQMAFPATQVGHGNFTGIYHPAQPVTGAAIHPLLQQSQAMAGPIDMNGPAPSVYQPSQPAPINWPKNC